MIRETVRRPPQPAVADLSAVLQQALEPWSAAYEVWRTGAVELLQRSPAPGVDRPARERQERCRGGSCERDRCACRCCVEDSDLILETRIGERRILSLVIENHWRRERDVGLELSAFTKTAGNVEIAAEIVGLQTFKLAPCAEAEIAIAVVVHGGKSEEKELADVKRCEVAYADLRITGCAVRPVRIAVAVLPRTCEAWRIDCACGCC